MIGKLILSVMIGAALGLVYADILIKMGMSVSHYFVALRVVMAVCSGMTGGSVSLVVLATTSNRRLTIRSIFRREFLELLQDRRKYLSAKSGGDSVESLAEVDYLIGEVEKL